MKQRIWPWLVCVGLILSTTQRVPAAGKLFARFPNQENSPVFHLQLKKFSATAEIQDRLAVVHIDETFFNDNSSTLEGIYFLELPEGSKVTEMALWINGERVEHEVKPRDEAVQEFEEIVRRSVDPLLAEEVAENVFRLRLFPLLPHGERRIEIKYIQPLPVQGETVKFLFPLRLEDYDAGVIDSTRLAIDLRTQTAIESVEVGAQVPVQKTAIAQVSATHYRIEFSEVSTIFDYDFTLLYRLAAQAVFVPLSFIPPDSVSGDGFFLLWAQPPASFFRDSLEARQIVLGMDVSASMIGDKLAQMKQALIEMITSLRIEDRFNIVAFNTTVESFESQLVPADSLNKSRAITYIQTLSATGLTNLNAALLRALAMFDGQAGPAQVLLISDGQPTAGETDPRRILENVRSSNAHAVQIFPVGIGEEVDALFFQELAQQNGGSAFFVLDGEATAPQLARIFEQISAPILAEVQIAQTGVITYDVLPETLPNILKGASALQTGRFLPPGTGTVTLRAHNGLDVVETSGTIDWSAAPHSKFFSRLWAAHKIASLQREVDLLGEDPELVEAIIFLSITYSVLSRYTAFLVVEPAGETPVTSVEGEESAAPNTFVLFQNFPNPFNPETKIRFQIRESAACGACQVTLRIYNLLGELIKTLVDERKAPGEYAAVWNGTDELGKRVASGIYVYELKVGDFEAARCMVLLR